MKTAKRALSCLLIAALCVSALFIQAPTASAYDVSNADYLSEHNLFKGTDKGYELDRSANRAEAAVMLIRVLGKETEGANQYASGAVKCRFTDVPAWAASSVAWLQVNGYVNGVSETEYGSLALVSAQQFAALLLRCLGYSETDGDFTYAAALDAAVQKRLISEAERPAMEAAFIRGDMVTMCFNALSLKLNGSEQTLYQKLESEGVFLKKDPAVQTPAEPVNTGDPLVYTRVTSSGVTADVVRVDMQSPRVTVRSSMVNNTLGATAQFSQIVSASGGADAVINANFFESYETFKKPIGHFVSDGVFRYGVSGLPGIGISSDKKVCVGMPSYFFKVTSGGSEWSIYECNSTAQAPDCSVIYNPSFGSTLTISYAGTIMTISGGVITGCRECVPGEVLTIPTDGYLVWMSYGFTGTNYYAQPGVGGSVTVTPYLHMADVEGFNAAGIVSLVSGAPRLVKDGAPDYAETAGFTEARFTTAVAPRTALGVAWDGDLILVSTGSASIEQMRHLMVALGCEDAINLDGGASAAMYCNGSFIRSPGRELTTTLQIFVD